MKKITELKDRIEKVYYDYCIAVDPCPYCKCKDRKNDEELQTCTQCAYHYASQFKMSDEYGREELDEQLD